MADELPDRSPLLTGQPSAPETETPTPRGVLISIQIEATPFGDQLQNGREAGAYVLGYWNRHLRDLPDSWDGTIELLATVRRDHLAAVLTTLVQAGVNATIYTDNGEKVTVRFFVEVASA